MCILIKYSSNLAMFEDEKNDKHDDALELEDEDNW